MPMPSRWSSVAGAVMLFHSPMSRMKKTRARCGRRGQRPEHRELAEPPRRHHEREQADARDGGRERDGRPRLSLGCRSGSRAAGPPGPPAVPDERDAERCQDEQPVIPRQRRDPGEQPGEGEGARRALQGRARPSTARPRPVAGTARSCPVGPCTSMTGPGSRPGSPAPIATARRAPASRAIAQVSGAAVAPINANGRADAQATSPKASRNGTWIKDASGIQWAFDGIGRTGSAGRTPPTSGKIQIKSMLKSVTGRQRPGDVDVIERIGVGRVRKVPDEHQTDGEGEPVQEEGDTHGRCSVAPGPGRASPGTNGPSGA